MEATAINIFRLWRIKMKLSVVIATRNEEDNIGKCIEAIKDIADEIIVVDEESIDRTREIAKRLGARVYKAKHQPNFHITKQKAVDLATGDWILQLDADERVNPKLAGEIKEVLTLKTEELKERNIEDKEKLALFKRHQQIIEQRDGPIGNKSDEITAFFVPRVNYFLGKPLKHAGLYPDGVIRLFRRGKAHFPAESVHEQLKVDGEVAWLFNDLEHHDSPTFNKYLKRMNRYTDLTAEEFKIKFKSKTNYLQLLQYSFTKPLFVFLNLYFRHLGFLDGMKGFIWSLFSSLHYPMAYFKFWQKHK